MLNERVVADMKSKGAATRIADESNVDAFMGQRYAVTASTLNPRKFAVVLFDGEIMDDPSKCITFRGGRDEARDGDIFAANLGQRERRNQRGSAVRNMAR